MDAEAIKSYGGSVARLGKGVAMYFFLGMTGFGTPTIGLFIILTILGMGRAVWWDSFVYAASTVMVIGVGCVLAVGGYRQTRYAGTGAWKIGLGLMLSSPILLGVALLLPTVGSSHTRRTGNLLRAFWSDVWGTAGVFVIFALLLTAPAFVGSVAASVHAAVKR